MPLLFAGVLAAGLLLGRPGSEGLISSRWVSGLVGGNSLGANLFASVAGAFMYFATLTEVPILQGLIGAGMGNGPALALLLAGPALSLPNMLVVRSILGTKKTAAYIVLVLIMSTVHKWPFLPGSAFSAGFRLRRTGSTPHRKPLCGLDLDKNCSFMNWKLIASFYNFGWTLTCKDKKDEFTAKAWK
jgi:hypothetical protein